MARRSSPLIVWILASYVGVALLQAWPLPQHLFTRLTGPPGGDTGVYVWNTWVFRHELIENHQSPFQTTTILPLDGPTDLSLHNYTVFSDALALPLQPWLGVVGAFNVVYLINVALAGFGMYVLAMRLTRRAAESWLAGLLFAWSPFLVARGGAHFSLAAAAPLPFFAYWLDRAWTTGRTRDALATGAMIAWAAFSDPYYAIYCGMLGAVIVASRVLTVTSTPSGAARGRLILDIAIAATAGLMVVVRGWGDGVLRIGGATIEMRTLYTPMLVLVCLLGARVAMARRWRVRLRPAAVPPHLVRVGAIVAASAAVVGAPLLYALVVRAAEGRLIAPPVLWRSSAPGVDLISFFLPNPNHPLAPDALVNWVSREPGRYEENVVSLSFVALLTLFAAWRIARFRPGRLWTVVTIGFASLALGPFVRIAGIATFVPTPWTFLRYAPIVDQARMPARFAVMALLGLCVLFAGALAALTARYPGARRSMLTIVGMALAFELLPAPRTLYSAEIPAVYQTVAADPRPVRVLELPFGIRDGLSSIGNFSAASQFYQTFHGKPLIGGYLSRVEPSTKAFDRAIPILDVLLDMSEGKHPAPARIESAHATATAFIADAEIGYVVVNREHVSEELRAFAIEALGLSRVAEGDGLELYTPHAHGPAAPTAVTAAVAQERDRAQ